MYNTKADEHQLISFLSIDVLLHLANRYAIIRFII